MRLVLLFAWLTLLPTCGVLPQNSHILLMTADSFQNPEYSKNGCEQQAFFFP